MSPATAPAAEDGLAPPPPLRTIAREWTRIGFLGFGGPPAHIVMLRDLVVKRERWIDADQFEDAVAATGLIPGPASTQMAIFCAGALGGWRGAVLGAGGFILPSFFMVVALSVLLLAEGAPTWVLAIGAGAGAAVPSIAVHAGVQLLPSSLQRASGRAARVRWAAWVLAGVVGAAAVGASVVLVLLGCGIAELLLWAWAKRASGGGPDSPTRGQVGGPGPGGGRLVSIAPVWVLGAAAGVASASVLASVAWMAFKVGALSYGGGFVIIPLMQHDAVEVHGWLTDAQFLTAVAIGQTTPGPVTNTIAAVGWSAAGFAGSVVGGLFAFGPSVLAIVLGGKYFEVVRESDGAQAFLRGGGPAALGAILGSAIPLAMGLDERWQWVVLAVALPALVSGRGKLLVVIGAAAAAGLVAWALGAPIPH